MLKPVSLLFCFVLSIRGPLCLFSLISASFFRSFWLCLFPFFFPDRTTIFPHFVFRPPIIIILHKLSARFDKQAWLSPPVLSISLDSTCSGHLCMVIAPTFTQAPKTRFFFSSFCFWVNPLVTSSWQVVCVGGDEAQRRFVYTWMSSLEFFREKSVRLSLAIISFINFHVRNIKALFCLFVKYRDVSVRSVVRIGNSNYSNNMCECMLVRMCACVWRLGEVCVFCVRGCVWVFVLPATCLMSDCTTPKSILKVKFPTHFRPRGQGVLFPHHKQQWCHH